MELRSRARTVTMTDRRELLVNLHFASFRKRFGRDPEHGDPVFFNTRADEPQPLNDLKMMEAIVSAMAASGTPPVIIFAYSRTGFMVSTGNKERFGKEQLDEWNAAIEEYFELEALNVSSS
jgi:hypothetical protein